MTFSFSILSKRCSCRSFGKTAEILETLPEIGPELFQVFVLVGGNNWIFGRGNLMVIEGDLNALLIKNWRLFEDGSCCKELKSLNSRFLNCSNASHLKNLSKNGFKFFIYLFFFLRLDCSKDFFLFFFWGIWILFYKVENLLEIWRYWMTYHLHHNNF